MNDTEIDDLLRQVRADVRTDEDVLARGRAKVLAAAADVEGVPVLKARTVESPKKKRSMWLAAAAAAVVVAGAVGTQLLPGDEAEIDVASAAILDRAAQAPGTDVPLAPGQFRYVETHAWNVNRSPEKDLTYRVESVTREWVPADERQEWLLRKEYTGNREFLSGDERDAAPENTTAEEDMRAPCGEYGTPTGGPGCEGTWQHPTAEWMAGLPRDPAKLGELLRADLPDNDRGEVRVFDYASDLLRTGRVPADLRSALYRVLATVPGIKQVDNAATLDGRVGTALGIEDDDSRHDIVIDPVTGQFIGERDVLVEDNDAGMKAGTVLKSSSVSTGTADEIGVVPAK
ncbi:CU044_5270 family protein [Amycolatopsis sp. 195334CR]|uniref:CU044_5270 family protein n=1 Tax=Amycolatopsis sp. 195334CR TaxID=2814588 RepID=UPI001A9072B2|nr:CU044_5270 family protein [Amycolatopsis sp. 195334CR]MBN6037622.1 CU044_5270 family protein [Amycolatopsis sp. 195334CR]